jgi:hypothetical protein
MLCRQNDMPVTDFMSLPDDIKAEILKRLDGSEDTRPGRPEEHRDGGDLLFFYWAHAVRCVRERSYHGI